MRFESTRGHLPAQGAPEKNAQPLSREKTRSGSQTPAPTQRSPAAGQPQASAAENRPRARATGPGPGPAAAGPTRTACARAAGRARGRRTSERREPGRAASSDLRSCFHALHTEAQGNLVVSSRPTPALTHRRGRPAPRPAPRPVAAGRSIRSKRARAGADLHRPQCAGRSVTCSTSSEPDHVREAPPQRLSLKTAASQVTPMNSWCPFAVAGPV